MIADPELAHQVVINLYAGYGIYVSCNCLAWMNPNGSRTHKVIQVRTRWDAADLLNVYRQWHADQGMALENVNDAEFN